MFLNAFLSNAFLKKLKTKLDFGKVLKNVEYSRKNSKKKILSILKKRSRNIQEKLLTNSEIF